MPATLDFRFIWKMWSEEAAFLWTEYLDGSFVQRQLCASKPAKTNLAQKRGGPKNSRRVAGGCQGLLRNWRGSFARMPPFVRITRLLGSGGGCLGTRIVNKQAWSWSRTISALQPTIGTAAKNAPKEEKAWYLHFWAEWNWTDGSDFATRCRLSEGQR